MAPSSPSKKLLITDRKPKPAPISASSSSTSTTPPQMPGMRTRNQPNFFDCHCCGRRIIHSNPKDRLQPLDSVWRIVLLCRKCRRSVCSGRTCPYCFQVTGNSDDFCTCIVCHRKIHKHCVRDFGKCTPWCYLGGWFEGFKVCVDCWVPDLLKNSVQILGMGENRGALKSRCEGQDLLEHLVRNGNPTCSGETKIVADADTAIQLHRAVNSSPRILRGQSLGNSNGLDAPTIRIWKGLFYKRFGLVKRCSEDRKVEFCTDSGEIGRVEHDSRIGFSRLNRRLIAYKRDIKRKIWQLDSENTEISEPTSSQQAELKNFYSDGGGVRSLLGRYGQELICYKRTKFKKKECQLNGLAGESGDGSSCNHGVDCCQSGCANLYTSSQVKSDCKGNFLSGSSDREHDRFRLQYVRRIQGTKTELSFLQDDTLLSEMQVSSPVSSCSDEFSANILS